MPNLRPKNNITFTSYVKLLKIILDKKSLNFIRKHLEEDNSENKKTIYGDLCVIGHRENNNYNRNKFQQYFTDNKIKIIDYLEKENEELAKKKALDELSKGGKGKVKSKKGKGKNDKEKMKRKGKENENGDEEKEKLPTKKGKSK